MRLALFSVVLIVFSSASFADIVSCNYNINGIVTPLEIDGDESVLNENYSFRELILRG